MDNVCRECGRKFLSDLRFCPHCGGTARPPRTKEWHYRSTGMIAHSDPIREDEVRVQRQNAWTLLCCGILLIPVWLVFLDGIGQYVREGDYLNGEVLSFYFLSGTVILVGVGVISAFEAVRPSVQVVAVGLVVIIATSWSTTAMMVLLTVYFLVVVRWAVGGGRSSRMDPTYLPVMSGIGILSLILMYLWLLDSPMIDLL